MPRVTAAAAAAVRVLELEGITAAFGVPGAAINPLYAAMRTRNAIRHVLARHVEAASHMADGYTRARAGNIGVCINPGRNEPGTGEIHYPFLFDLLDQEGYAGWIGCEYKPRAATSIGLSWAAAYLGRES